MNRKTVLILTLGICAAVALFLGAGTGTIGDTGLNISLDNKYLAPSLEHVFGTDWMGRDMLTRTLYGLRISLLIGVVTASISAVLGGALGLMAGTFGGLVDDVISWLIDTVMSVPHLVLIILIAFVLGGGVPGVIGGVVLTHWATVARVVRAESTSLWKSEFVAASLALGRSRWWAAFRHVWPHVVGQLIVSLVLLFPHAVLHEASITFLGLGLSSNTPAVGIILSESMRYMTAGYWWLAVLPGAALLAMVKLVDIAGEALKSLSDPRRAQL